jgi:hypothetical protein
MAVSLTVLLGLLGAYARAQEPVAGQPYAIPQGYESYPAGTLITYGGYNYVAQGNGTMLLAGNPDNSTPDDSSPGDDTVPIDTTAYQIPPGYENAQPGSQISYGGNDYTVMSGGTMMMSCPAYTIQDGTQYQIPPDCAGAGAGSIVTCGGSNYLVAAGVMVRININVGYSTMPNPGTSGLSLTSSGRNPSTHPGQPQGRPTQPVYAQHPTNPVHPQGWGTQHVYPQWQINPAQPQGRPTQPVYAQHPTNPVHPQGWAPQAVHAQSHLNQGPPPAWSNPAAHTHAPASQSYTSGFSGGHVARRR